MGDFLGLVDLTSDDQCVAIRHVPGDCADHMRLPSGRERPVDRNAPDGIIHLEIGRKPFQVARYLAAVCAEQTGILNAAGVRLQMVIDRIQPAFARQTGNEVQLTANHFVGSCDQVLIGLPVDKAEQHDDENREHACYRQRPPKGVRT